ncbi:hypothetical protein CAUPRSCDRAFT_12870, partial [Caulochytrium protostelioides]
GAGAAGGAARGALRGGRRGRQVGHCDGGRRARRVRGHRDAPQGQRGGALGGGDLGLARLDGLGGGSLVSGERRGGNGAAGRARAGGAPRGGGGGGGGGSRVGVIVGGGGGGARVAVRGVGPRHRGGTARGMQRIVDEPVLAGRDREHAFARRERERIRVEVHGRAEGGGGGGSSGGGGGTGRVLRRRREVGHARQAGAVGGGLHRLVRAGPHGEPARGERRRRGRGSRCGERGRGIGAGGREGLGARPATDG